MPDSERSALSELLWAAWGSLGLSSWVRTGVSTVVDPEALIVASAAARDERLFLESIDWGIRHARLLVPSRLRRMAPDANVVERIDAWIGTVGQHASGVTWKVGRSAALAGYEPSNKSGSFRNAGDPAVAAAALRMRSALGATARSEVVRSMHVVAAGHENSVSSSEVAWLAATTNGQANALLDDLVRAGFVIRNGTPKRRRYAPAVDVDDPLVAGLWRPWQTMAFGPWMLAPAITAHLTAIHRLTSDSRPRSAAVEALTHFEALRPLLGRVDASLVAPLESGSAATVLDAMRVWARHASERFATHLANGVQAPESVPTAGMKERFAATPSTTNPWASRPFG